MDAMMKPIESALAPLFKGIPSLPETTKKALVKYWPIIALVFGILQLLAVWGLWQASHVVNLASSYANELSIAAGYGPTTTSLGFIYYVALASLVVDAIILLLAYSPLKAHREHGWYLLFLGAMLNLVYGVIMVFEGRYGGFGSLLGALLGSAVGLYLLFQVRSYYTPSGSVQPNSTSQSPKDTTSATKTK